MQTVGGEATGYGGPHFRQVEAGDFFKVDEKIGGREREGGSSESSENILKMIFQHLCQQPL